MKKILETLKRKWAEYLLEIIVIIIGILGAYTLNSWKEDNIEGKKELQLLNQLHSDFLTNRQIIEKGQESLKRDYDIAVLTISHTGIEAVWPTDREISDSLTTLFYSTVNLVPNTINSSLTESQIDLIKINELKTKLSAFPSYFELYKEFEMGIRELTIRQRLIHQKYVVLSDIESRFKSSFKSDFNGWLRDREYHNITIEKVWHSRWAEAELKKVEKMNNAIIELIEKELGK